MVKSDCENIRNSLLNGEESLAAEQHVGSCEDCARWLDAQLSQSELESLSGTLEEPADQVSAPNSGLTRLEQLLVAEEGWGGRVRSLPTTARFRALLLVILSAVTLQLLFFYRADMAVYPKPRLSAETLAHSVVLLGLLAALLRPAYRVAWPRSAGVALGVAGLLLPMVVAATNPAHALHPASLTGMGADFWPRALGCMSWGSLMGLPLVVMAALMDRSPGLSWWKLSLLVGLGVGTGSLALLMHCPVVHPEHLWAGHVLIAAPLCGVAAVTTYLAKRQIHWRQAGR